MDEAYLNGGIKDVKYSWLGFTSVWVTDKGSWSHQVKDGAEKDLLAEYLEKGQEHALNQLAKE